MTRTDAAPWTPEQLGPSATENDVAAINWVLDNTELTEDEVWNDGSWTMVVADYLSYCDNCGYWFLDEDGAETDRCPKHREPHLHLGQFARHRGKN